jgi:hypothetical protein
MAFNTPLTKTENYIFGRGVGYFAPFDANGRPMGERDLGNLPGLSLNVTTEKAEHFSSRSGIAKKDRSVVVSVAFNGTLEFEDFSAENAALFLGGSATTITQSSSPVANERIYNLEPQREYQLGASSSNPTGVRGVGSVAVGIYECENAAARANSTAVTKGQIFKSGTDVFLVTTAGTTAGSAPTYDVATVGNATTDGTAVVKFLGITGAYTVGTADSSDYWLATEAARVGIPSAGRIGLAAALYTTVTDEVGTAAYLSLIVDYTPQANTRTQITSTAAGSVEGQFRFVADNAEGTNRDLFIASCALAPSGDLSFITGTEFGKASFELGVNEKDTSTPLVIIDGRPV